VSETPSRENNARVEAVTRRSTEKSGGDWTWPYNAHTADVRHTLSNQSNADFTTKWKYLAETTPVDGEELF
jgi:hypothetical protein